MKCPECQRQNPEDAKFCNECACNLKEFFDTAETALSTEGERKYATIMFSDLSGYTRMAERLDPEEVKDILSLVFGKINEIIKSYDGFVEKYIGDAVMAVFGVPKAHEDDPIRAIRAAMEMNTEIESLNPQLEDLIGQPLTLHTGINTGLIVTGEVDVDKGTHGLAGDAINLASRLQGIAKAGDIIVGPETYSQTLNMFSFEKLEPTRIKGKQKPVSIFRVQSIKKISLKTHRLQGLQAVLTGREKEMKILDRGLQRLIQGNGSVISISGDAGTGKSRLKKEFKDSLESEQILWLEGHAYSYARNIPYYPLVNLLTRAFRIEDGDTPETIKFKVEAAVTTLLGKDSSHTPYIGSLFALDYPEIRDVSPEYWKEKLKESIELVLLSLVENNRVVVCFEDLHWADPSFIALFKRLISRVNQRALFLFTQRSHFKLFDAKSSENIADRYVEIELNDLSIQDAQEMLKSLLDCDLIPEKLFSLIEQKTQGNPYYLEEMINSLIERQILVSHDNQWLLSHDISEKDIPATIHGVLTARIDRLGKHFKRLLQEASVIGRSFLYKILENITDVDERIDVYLHGLESLNLIKTQSLEPELEYIFKHALTQDVVYNNLLKRERLEIHYRIAVAIEKIFCDRITEFFEILAYHYAKSHSSEKAVTFYVKAGNKSLAKFALEEASLFFKKAYRLVLDNQNKISDWDNTLIGLLNQWSFVLYYQSDYGSIYRIIKQYEGIAINLNDKTTTAMYYAWLGWSYFGIEQYEAGERYLLRALKIGEETQSNEVVAYACTWYSWTLTTMGRFDEAITFGERAVQLARDYDLDTYLHFKPRAGVANAYWYRGDRLKSLEQGKKLEAFGKSQGHIPALTFGYLEIGASCLSDGDFKEALYWFERIVDEQKDFIYYHAALLLQGLTNFYIGEYEKAENVFEDALRYLQENSRFPWLATPGELFLGGVWVARGRMKDGMQKILLVRKQLHKTGYKFFYTVSEYLLGGIYLSMALGEGEVSVATFLKNIGFIIRQLPFAKVRAEKHLKQTVHLADEIGAKSIKGQALLDIGRLYLSKKRIKEAREYLIRSIEVFDQCKIDTFRKQAVILLDTIK
jgi:class 3 adenylate cyclase/tetratricopeptide (TPR) repeat protein